MYFRVRKMIRWRIFKNYVIFLFIYLWWPMIYPRPLRLTSQCTPDMTFTNLSKCILLRNNLYRCVLFSCSRFKLSLSLIVVFRWTMSCFILIWMYTVWFYCRVLFLCPVQQLNKQMLVRKQVSIPILDLFWPRNNHQTVSCPIVLFLLVVSCPGVSSKVCSVSLVTC